MKRWKVSVSVLLMLAAAVAARGESAPGAASLLPIKEVTVFKDGHALVVHEGSMPVDESGNVVLDYLPTPVLGTFWPFAFSGGSNRDGTERSILADEKGRPLASPKLMAVTSGQRKVAVARTALNVRELMEANIGAEIVVVETNGQQYDAKIVEIPKRSADENEKNSPPESRNSEVQKGDVALLKVASGTRAIPLNLIAQVIFKSPTESKLTQEEIRNRLRLQLQWSEGKRPPTANVGMMYVQRGLRWIPEYKVVIDGKGNAQVKLQATLVNDLVDLKDVTSNLVIGAPKFEFEGQNDPISLQRILAATAARSAHGVYGQQMSNAIMTQVAAPMRMDYELAAEPAPEIPEVAGSEKAEDLFVFTVQHITLAKGERMVVPVAEFTVPYRDVFVLNLPFAPPPEMWQNMGGRQAEVAQLLAAPKVMHSVRLKNSSTMPLTTAPAMVMLNDRVLAQGLMTYAAPGASADVAINPAVDIQVSKSDKETKRDPGAIRWNGDNYMRIDLAGTVTLTNRRAAPVEVEIVRNVLGTVDSAENNGEIVALNMFEDLTASPDGRPAWWINYSWPYWWSRFNSVGRVTWKQTIESGKSAELKYQWHYFWR